MRFYSFFKKKKSKTLIFEKDISIYFQYFHDLEEKEYREWQSIDMSKIQKIVFHPSMTKALLFFRSSYEIVRIESESIYWILKDIHKHNIPYLILEPTLFSQINSFLLSSLERIGSSIFFMCIIPLLFHSFAPPSSSISPLSSPFEIISKQNETIEWIGSLEILHECMETASLFSSSEINPLRGLLLEGEPGVGKTLLARKIASELNASFIPVIGSQFVEMYIGIGAQRARQLFKMAHRYKPCIIFIDEIDSIASKRSTFHSESYNEAENTLNQILAEMDGFTRSSEILVIGATNRVSVLDKALLRPGRFDRIIHIPLPDKKVRDRLFSYFLGNSSVSKGELSQMVDMTEGFSGADIEKMVKEASIYAHRRDSSIIEWMDLDLALEKHFLGILKSEDTRSELERKRIAIHECGHAISVFHYPSMFRLYKISIRSNYQGVGGFTLYDDSQYQDLWTREFLEKKIMILLGGKCAEELYYGKWNSSIGSQQDLLIANKIVSTMFTEWGYSEKYPHYASLSPTDIFQEEINLFIQSCYERVSNLLQHYSSLQTLCVNKLMEKQSLGMEDIKEFHAYLSPTQF